MTGKLLLSFVPLNSAGAPATGRRVAAIVQAEKVQS
jgi:hypothetical protein